MAQAKNSGNLQTNSSLFVGAQPHLQILAPQTVHGLFINTSRAKCSIYQSGRMVYENIKTLKEYNLDYLELSDINIHAFNETAVLLYQDGELVKPKSVEKPSYDFIIFNYHPHTMAPYLDASRIRQIKNKTFSVVLEIDPGNAYAQLPRDLFDGLLVLDPTIAGDKMIWPFPRPLEGMPRNPPNEQTTQPRIGSFGFGTPGKGFDLLVSAVNIEFDQAFVRINIPPSSYADDIMKTMHRKPYSEYLGDICKRIAKPGIKVEVTHDFMSETELVDWCESNDINCFMYTRRQSGLSATTDQAIIAGRPLLISANDTFRHIHPYISPYPRNTIKSALAHTQPAVLRMQKDWSTHAFGDQFLSMLRSFDLLPLPQASISNRTNTHTVLLQPKLLVCIRKRPSEPTLMHWEDRVVSSISKTVFASISVLMFNRISEIRAALFWSRCTGLLILSEHPDPEIELDIMRSGTDLKIPPVFACRYDSPPNSDRSVITAQWIELGPIIPFYTVLTELPAGRPIISFYGFDAPGSNLADVVAKIQRELGVADLRICLTCQLPPDAAVFLERRISFIRTQLLPTPGITITVAQPCLNLLEIMSSLAQNTVNIFYNSTDNYSSKIENFMDLAMAVDRIATHTRASPVRGYETILPTLELRSFQEILQNGVALQSGAYNQLSEGRVLFRLEESLLLSEGQTQGVMVTPRAAAASPPKQFTFTVNPNGLIGRDWQTGLGTAILEIKTKNLTNDDLYRSETLSQQGYLLHAIQSICDIELEDELILIGDRNRKSAIVLGELGYSFSHFDVVTSKKASKNLYKILAFLNAVSGQDELVQWVRYSQKMLAPGGIALMTFFFGEIYNLDQTDKNPDFPLLTALDVAAALEAAGTSMSLVTPRDWQSDLPCISPKPFELPPYGALTLRKPAVSGKS